MKTLKNKIALVAGATRGAGRGIACALGEAGATVYCTGRSSRSNRKKTEQNKSPEFNLANRPETIEETAEMVTARGGVGIPIQVDHTVEDQVEKLFQRIKEEQGGLDILVNDIWGGEELTEFGKPFWEVTLEKGFRMLEIAVHTHIITSRYGAPLMMNRDGALIVEITDGDSYSYRGNIFYDLVKTSVIRLAFIMARELRKRKVSAVAVTPGFLRSESMLEHFGVTEENWRDGAKKDANFIASETPLYVGRAIACLASDSELAKKSGRVFSSWMLSREYDFTDADGSRPDWGKHFEETYHLPLKRCDDAFYEHWLDGAIDTIFGDWP